MPLTTFRLSFTNINEDPYPIESINSGSTYPPPKPSNQTSSYGSVSGTGNLLSADLASSAVTFSLFQTGSNPTRYTTKHITARLTVTPPLPSEYYVQDTITGTYQARTTIPAAPSNNSFRVEAAHIMHGYLTDVAKTGTLWLNSFPVPGTDWVSASLNQNQMTGWYGTSARTTLTAMLKLPSDTVYLFRTWQTNTEVQISQIYYDVLIYHPNELPPIEPEPEPEPPPGTGATTPPEAPGTSTILEQVRIFSGAVRRAVRLTGPKEITMVDPNESMGGLVQSDADSLYTSADELQQAGLKVLSTKKGSLTMGSAQTVVTDDARVPESGWKIPGRLPVYNLDPSPIKRVTMTFTPNGFYSSVDAHVPDVPLHVRRT